MKEDIYSSKQISLPTPHFVVLYNGETKKPDRFEYRLSDAYTQKEESYDLELKVTVVNVNKGHNPDIMARCKTLDEFAEFTEVLRDYNKTMEISQATLLCSLIIGYHHNHVCYSHKITPFKKTSLIDILSPFAQNKKETTTNGNLFILSKYSIVYLLNKSLCVPVAVNDSIRKSSFF